MILFVTPRELVFLYFCGAEIASTKVRNFHHEVTAFDYNVEDNYSVITLEGGARLWIHNHDQSIMLKLSKPTTKYNWIFKNTENHDV